MDELTETLRDAVFIGQSIEEAHLPGLLHDAVTDPTALAGTIAVRVRITAAWRSGWINDLIKIIT